MNELSTVAASGGVSILFSSLVGWLVKLYIQNSLKQMSGLAKTVNTLTSNIDVLNSKIQYLNNFITVQQQKQDTMNQSLVLCERDIAILKEKINNKQGYYGNTKNEN